MKVVCSRPPALWTNQNPLIIKTPMKAQTHSSISLPTILAKAVLFILVLFTFPFSPAYSSTSSPYNSVINKQAPVSTSNQKTLLFAQRPAIEQASKGGWKTYRNEKYGFKINYPKTSKIIENGEIRISLPVTSGTSLLEKYLTINIKENSSEECSNPAQALIEKAGTVTINGIEFKKEVGTEGAAGSIYHSLGYSTMRESRCFELNFVLHSVNLRNIDHPPPAFNEEKESRIFDQILSTFRFLSEQ